MATNNITLNSSILGRTILIDGHVVHFAESEGDKPILLVHGLGFSLYSMRNVYNDLAERGYRVIAVDIPGCGYSKAEPRIKMTPDEVANILSKLLDSLKIKKTNIYAIAEGAIYALRMCQMYPENVNSMVLASPGSFTMHFPLKYRNLAFPILGEIMLKIMERKHINKFLRWIMFDETAVTAPLERQTFQPFTQKEARLGLLNLIRDYMDIAVFNNLKNIFCPTKIIWGEYDKGHPVKMCELFLKRIEDSSFTLINNSGHLVHEERPKMVCDVIDRFVSFNS
jgi:pimeloyl-ACP methyl ester carboxylesterase